MKSYTNTWSTQKITYLALLAATCVVGRLLFTWLPNIQPMTTVFLLLAFYTTLSQALFVALLGLLVTNLYLGMGTWTISQMIAYTVIICFFYCLRQLPLLQKHRFLQAILAFLCGLLYGFVVSIMEVFIYQLPSFWAYYFQGLSFDLMHGVGNFGFYLLLAPIFCRLILPKLQKL
ncbi:MAG: cobalamin ECF transporter [Enterococcus sp.]